MLKILLPGSFLGIAWCFVSRVHVSTKSCLGRTFQISQCIASIWNCLLYSSFSPLQVPKRTLLAQFSVICLGIGPNRVLHQGRHDVGATVVKTEVVPLNVGRACGVGEAREVRGLSGDGHGKSAVRKGNRVHTNWHAKRAGGGELGRLLGHLLLLVFYHLHAQPGFFDPVVLQLHGSKVLLE